VVDVVRCFVERRNAFERLVGVMATLALAVDEHFYLDIVGVDADDASSSILAWNPDVIAEL
jgi:hypothetical protein